MFGFPTSFLGRLFSACLVCVWSGALTAPGVQADGIERASEIEAATADAAIQERISRVRDLIASGESAAAVQLLSELSLSQPPGLVKSTQVFGLYRPVHAVVAELVGELPENMRKSFQKISDEGVQEELDKILASHDWKGLQVLIRSRPGSALSTSLWMAAGDMALERGWTGIAARCYEAAKPPHDARFGEESLEPSEVQAAKTQLAVRKVLLNHLLQNAGQVRTGLQDLQSSRYAEQTIELGGARGPAYPLLVAYLEQAKQRQSQFASRRRLDSPDARGNLFAAAEASAAPWRPDFGQIIWRRADLFGGRPGILAWGKIPSKQAIFLGTSTGLAALELQSGKSLWPQGGLSGPASSGQPFEDSVSADQPETAQPEKDNIPKVFETLWLQGDTLLATTRQLPSTRFAFSDMRIAPVSQLASLDLQREGAVRWNYPSPEEELQFASEGWSFWGDIAVHPAPWENGNGRQGIVFLPLEKRGRRSEFHIAAISLRDGREIWRRRVCGIPAEDFDRHAPNRPSVAMVEGRLYCHCPIGAVACLDPQNGEMLWMLETAAGASNRKYIGEKKRPEAKLAFRQGWLYVMPEADGGLLCLNSLTGAPRWQSPPLEGAKGVMGLQNNRVLLTGEHLYALNADSGKQIWKWPEDKKIELVGRAAVYHEHIAAPLSARELVVLDGVNGWPVQNCDAAVHGVAAWGDLSITSVGLLVTTKSSVEMVTDLGPLLAPALNAR